MSNKNRVTVDLSDWRLQSWENLTAIIQKGVRDATEEAVQLALTEYTTLRTGLRENKETGRREAALLLQVDFDGDGNGVRYEFPIRGGHSDAIADPDMAVTHAEGLDELAADFRRMADEIDAVLDTFKNAEGHSGVQKSSSEGGGHES